jgi:predicted nucleotide-binding protein/DNA-directed RNA polymerase subunit RPC12/RpoP
MTVEFHCASCTTKLQVAREAVGKRVKCPKCGEIILVPEQDAALVPVAQLPVPAPPAARPASYFQELTGTLGAALVKPKIDDLLQEAGAQIGALFQAGLVQDLSTARQVREKLRAIRGRAALALGAEDLSYFVVLENLGEVVTSSLLLTKEQMEGDNPAALGRCKTIVRVSTSSIDALRKLLAMEQGPNQNELLVLQGLFVFYLIIAKASEQAMFADEDLFHGHVSDYLEKLKDAAGVLEEGYSFLANINVQDVVPLLNMIQAMADRYRRRINIFQERYDPKRHYMTPRGTKVFLIHGHGMNDLRALESLIKTDCGLDSLVLRDMVNQGETVIEKFREFAHQCFCAVCLMTADDVVETTAGKRYAQARPNVIFELGWFYGRFGPKRICIVKAKDVVVPSDLAGILCLEYEKDVAECLADLKKELSHIAKLD